MLGLLTIIEIFLTAVLAQCIYYRYLHPLSRYPGPFLASFSDLWYAINPSYPAKRHNILTLAQEVRCLHGRRTPSNREKAP